MTQSILQKFLGELKEATGETWKSHETPQFFLLRIEQDTKGVRLWEAPEEVRNWRCYSNFTTSLSLV